MELSIGNLLWMLLVGVAVTLTVDLSVVWGIIRFNVFSHPKEERDEVKKEEKDDNNKDECL